MGTKANTRAPVSRASLAISGVAPPPVPPPNPARRKIRSTPSKVLRTLSFSSLIAFRARAVSPPVPMPRVKVLPIAIFSDAMESANALASTSITSCSTPVKLSNRKPSTRDKPAPPTPITFALSAVFSWTDTFLESFSKRFS